MKIKTSAIVLCAVAAFALHAANPADSKTPDKKTESKVVFTEDFETKNNKSWAVRPGYVFQRGEGVDATGGLSLSRPDAAAAYTFSRCNVTGFQPGHKYRLSMMIKVQGLKKDGKPLPYVKIQVAGFDFFEGKKYLGAANIPVAVKNGNADWKEYSTVFTVPGKVRAASLCFFLRKPYTCDKMSWDNIKVEEIGGIAK